jgi:beta-lactamase class D
MKKNIARLLSISLLTSIIFAKQVIADSNLLDKNSLDKDSRCQQNCTLVILSDSDNKFTFINQQRAEQRFSPFSTFKIANSLIALDSGVVKNTQHLLTFDINKYPIKKWWPQRWYKTPLTLTKAFEYSAVPIYQQIANDIGSTKMQHYIDRFDYGNKNINDHIDSFWLNEALKISAKEQVRFLQKIYHHQLDLKAQSYQQLKQIMLVEQTENYKFYVKTGTGHIHKNEVLGWYVGYVENSQGVYFFALNMSANKFLGVTKSRINITKHYLKQAGII